MAPPSHHQLRWTYHTALTALFPLNCLKLSEIWFVSEMMLPPASIKKRKYHSLIVTRSSYHTHLKSTSSQMMFTSSHYLPNFFFYNQQNNIATEDYNLHIHKQPLSKKRNHSFGPWQSLLWKRAMRGKSVLNGMSMHNSTFIFRWTMLLRHCKKSITENCTLASFQSYWDKEKNNHSHFFFQLAKHHRSI